LSGRENPKPETTAKRWVPQAGEKMKKWFRDKCTPGLIKNFNDRGGVWSGKKKKAQRVPKKLSIWAPRSMGLFGGKTSLIGEGVRDFGFEEKATPAGTKRHENSQEM